MSPDGSRSAVMTRSPASLGSAPTIVTDRLVLRGFREGDFGAFHALSADEQVMSQITGRALTTDESWTRMTSFAGSWLLTGIGAWAVESREEVDRVHECLLRIGATILDRPADYPQYNKGRGYYAVFFSDPDGLKLECVYTPPLPVRA